MIRRLPKPRARCYVCGETRRLAALDDRTRLCPKCASLARRYGLTSRPALHRMRGILRQEVPERFTDRGQFAFEFLDGA